MGSCKLFEESSQFWRKPQINIHVFHLMEKTDMTTPPRKARTYRLTAVTVSQLEILPKVLDTNKTGVLELAVAQLATRYPVMPIPPVSVTDTP